MVKTYYQKLSEFIEKHKLRPIVDVIIFSVIIVLFHKLWWDWGLKGFMLDYLSFTELEQFMAVQVFIPSSCFIDHILGYDFKTLGTTMYFTDGSWLAVNGSCSGLKQFYQWIILMVLFPGPWKQKLWYIPMGIVVIHLVNIFRIIILAVIMQHAPDYWHLSHDWILRPFFYVVIFAMWVIWVEKFRYKKAGGKS